LIEWGKCGNNNNNNDNNKGTRGRGRALMSWIVCETRRLVSSQVALVEEEASITLEFELNEGT